MTEDPTVIPSDGTVLALMFASPTIEVLKEAEAYPFLSLVADCGGVLGLFIGFNFMIIWDWVLITVMRFLPDIKHNNFPKRVLRKRRKSI